MIITTAIFEGDISLVIGSDIDVQASVQRAIEQYEPEYLNKTLGRNFANDFTGGLTTSIEGGFSDAFSDGFDIGSVDPRWIWLRDGHTYAINGYPFVWVGIKKAIADYVYFWYRRNHRTNTTSTGAESAAKFENSDTASSGDKAAQIWNDMAAINQDLFSVIAYAKDDTTGLLLYPEYRESCSNNEMFQRSVNAMNI